MKKVIALIPCRGNSKGIKNKNLVNFFGKPLMYWTIKQLKDCKIIKEIYVTSDSKNILNYAKKLKVGAIKRPVNLSGDNAQSEGALLHAIKKKKLYSDIIIFPQVTSPLRPKNVFSKALNIFLKNNLDSLFSSNKVHYFLWNKKKKLIPNYNYNNRPMRQKVNSINENGSFYIFNTKKFLTSKNRLFGKIGTYIIEKKYSFDIDDDVDLKINKILKNEKN
ncbi:acylneuraminate cytidylyltransferase family protein [Candidatus Pelagibacter sp.]|nr:acylneuraminate cytidylyltransferase family protein [Candidatus Pelagibacter sp.]